MRKLSLSFMAVALFLCTVVMNIFCKKKDPQESCRGSIGFAATSKYVFWIAQDLNCGIITVSVKDEQGETVHIPETANKIKIYNTTEPQNACATNDADYYKRASVGLRHGYNYTYTASCAGRTWTGKISVACGQQACNLIQLK